MTLHYITLHYITLHYIALHYSTIHYIPLPYLTLPILLHYFTLHTCKTFRRYAGVCIVEICDAAVLGIWVDDWRLPCP